MSFYETAFCCFDDLTTGSRYVVGFTAVTAVANLIINIFLLVNVHWFLNHLEPFEEWTWVPPGSLALLYIELVFNLIFLFLAYVLHSGIKENELRNKRYCCLGWGIGVGAARGYEIFLMIYFLVWLGSYRVTDLVYVYSEGLFIVAYWVINTAMLFLALMLVNYYYKEQYYRRRGKMKRINFIAALRKIRNKAITRIVKHTTGAPSFASMGMLGQSRGPSVGSMSAIGTKPRTQSTMSGATYSSVPGGPQTPVTPGSTYDMRTAGPRPGMPGPRYPPPRGSSTMVGGPRPMGPPQGQPRPMGQPGPRPQGGPMYRPGPAQPVRGQMMQPGPAPGQRMRQPYFPVTRPSQGD